MTPLPAPLADSVLDLAAVAVELRRETDSYIRHAVAVGATPERAEEVLRHRRDVSAAEPEHIGWAALNAELAADEASALAAWDRVKEAARLELETGHRAARTVEGPASNPMDRARFLELYRSLRDSLRPTGGLELRLVEQMAQAITMHELWLHRHMTYESLDDIRDAGELEDERRGYRPPRLRSADASDRAAALADRWQRAFLRLLRAFRDQRRLLNTVIVADGGQLNVATQQVVTGRTPEEDMADGA